VCSSDLVYIRNTNSSLLYAGEGKWCSDCHEAASFQTIPAAQKTIRHDHLDAVEFVLMESANCEPLVVAADQLSGPIPDGADEPEL